MNQIMYLRILDHWYVHSYDTMVTRVRSIAMYMDEVRAELYDPRCDDYKMYQGGKFKTEYWHELLSLHCEWEELRRCLERDEGRSL